MREDLLDAYAAVDWAVAQLPFIRQEIEAWINVPPYLLNIERHPEMGQRHFKLEINRSFPATINAAVGAAINSIRSSLDLLASVLATRNGKRASADRHFPIYGSIHDFVDPLNMAKRKQWLSERERCLIEALQPYDGGNDFLVALHRLDVKRKHERLIRVQLSPTSISIKPQTSIGDVHFPTPWPGFEDGAVIAWTAIDAPDCDVDIAANVTLDEAEVGSKPLIETLRQFGGLADSIIQLFE
jgi:hypothetical protein